MGYILSTSEVCSTLGVSRAWVNTYLRPLGGIALPTSERTRANLRTIYYDSSDILRWCNDNASFSRQTVVRNLLDYIPKDLHSELTDILSMPDSTQNERIFKAKTFDDFYEYHYPDELKFQLYRGDSRSRGQIPWIPVTHEITDLSQLKTMKQLMDAFGYRSQELVYRKIFSLGWLRVEILGHTWFIDPEEPTPKYRITLPADFV